MKRIIFFSVPAYGHLTAVQPVIANLVKQGYDVTWFCSAKYKDYVLTSGAKFEEYEIDFESLCKLNEATDDIISLLEYLLKLNRQFYLIYSKKNYQADLIIFDSMCSFAKNIAIKQNIPNVCFCTTLAYNIFTFVFSNLFISSLKLFIRNTKRFIKILREEHCFRKKQCIKALDLIDIFVNKGDKTIVFSPKEFQPFAWTFNRNVQFVGTTIKDRINLDKTTYEHYDVYISFGTIMTEQKYLLDKIQNSSWVKKHKTIINIGNLKLQRSCDNVELTNHTNQLELLKNCNIFINHGGINSIYESIERGIVQVCIPQQEEQRMNAIIVQQKKLGLYMQTFDEERIKKMEKNLPKYQKRISEFGNIIRKYDGTTNALNIIKSLLIQHS